MRNRIHLFGRGTPWRPMVLYDVFKDADAALRVESERPRQLRLPGMNHRLVGVEPLLEEQRKRVIYADFHYAALEDVA